MSSYFTVEAIRRPQVSVVTGTSYGYATLGLELPLWWFGTKHSLPTFRQLPSTVPAIRKPAKGGAGVRGGGEDDWWPQEKAWHPQILV